MSTKATLKSRLRVDGQPSFHLYDDVLTKMTNEPPENGGSATNPPVYLTLESVEVELRTLP